MLDTWVEVQESLATSASEIFSSHFRRYCRGGICVGRCDCCCSSSTTLLKRMLRTPAFVALHKVLASILRCCRRGGYYIDGQPFLLASGLLLPYTRSNNYGLINFYDCCSSSIALKSQLIHSIQCFTCLFFLLLYHRSFVSTEICPRILFGLFDDCCCCCCSLFWLLTNFLTYTSFAKASREVARKSYGVYLISILFATSVIDFGFFLNIFNFRDCFLVIYVVCE